MSEPNPEEERAAGCLVIYLAIGVSLAVVIVMILAVMGQMK